MDEMYSSIWLHQESIEEMEMRQRLQNTLSEVEALKIGANEQARIHQEEVNHLLSLVKLAQRERDEVKQHLAHLLQNPSNPITLPTTTNPNSSITESNTFSQSSSPSSPELSSFIDQQPPLIPDDPTAQVDPLDDLVKGKALPETGSLLKAVIEAGPLLQTLIVAGPLPQWTNPPPLPLRFAVPPPPVSRRCDSLTSCSASVSRFGFGSVPVFDNQLLARKRPRLE